MTVFYISGPMRGMAEHNYPTFLAIEDALRGLTGEDTLIFNPARNFDGDKTREVAEYMREDISQVLAADTVVLLPGWENSEGAKLEVALARALNHDFLRAVPETYDGTTYRWVFEGIEPGDGDSLNVSPRASALNEAKALICGDRNAAYGPPTQDFARTADMASAFGFRVVPHEGADATALDAHHVAVFMMLLKTSRLAWTPGKRDSWVDAAGYAACGYECAVEEAA